MEDVLLWAAVQPSMRSALFSDPPPEARSPRGVELPLHVLHRKLRDEHADAETVSQLCTQISEWAESNGSIRTAIHFAQAAAVASPTAAENAYRTGRLSRMNAQHARAESWFRRAIVLGRSASDWTTYTRALSGLGNLYRQKGDYPAAKHFHSKTLRAAREHGLPELRGDALHDLSIVSYESGDPHAGTAYGRQAYTVRGRHHPKLPALANDLALFWMIYEGAFSRVLPIFQELLRYVWEPMPRLFVLANICRSAGGSGARDVFDKAWGEVWEMLTLTGNRQGHAAAFVELAHGAMMLRRWRQAAAAAERALAIATERHECAVQRAAAALLQAIRNEARASVSVSSSGVAGRAEDELAETLVAALRPH
ncbi:MAG TPA: tetratricopeptide repeat protein [Longimicrobiaceae bacterium]|nr:tetratricopeptide repeat protein [Longimicrobiaceae bacterium]